MTVVRFKQTHESMIRQLDRRIAEALAQLDKRRYQAARVASLEVKIMHRIDKLITAIERARAVRARLIAATRPRPAQARPANDGAAS